ncbi:low molecular weight protein arginine phosphatase [Syntrophomonas palmitatica]|uniref:low molecular weight protein arginine phosphatase n=1 Tax=Syntrophomonas palmitatica TaxID=402877 RepID=UPI0006CF34F3|nr:low molecular weight protein arginine phosphatase [Syntrophomonas palmitatica]
MNILIICSGNTCRSPMAQALLTDMLKKRQADIKPGKITVASAGLYAVEGAPAAREAMQVMTEQSLDLSWHRSRQLCQDMLDWADLVLTMNGRQAQEIYKCFPGFKGMIYTLGNFAGQDNTEVKDPLGWGISAYRECAQQLRELLELAVERIIQEFEI